ncbi:MAG: Ig-like domain-containing protein [Lachnospiraceae bacterium]
MSFKQNKGKKLCALVLSLALLFTTVFSGTTAQAALPKGATINRYSSVRAGSITTYTIKNLKKGQYAKISVSGTASAGITLKIGGDFVHSDTMIAGTGEYIKLSVANHNVVGKRFTLSLRTYNSKSKRKVGATSTTSAFVYRRTTDINLDQTSVTLKEGETAQLKAGIKPSNATQRVRWKSSNEQIATVEQGLITGVTAGTVTITATSGSVSANCEVTVNEKEPAIQSFLPTTSKTLTVTFDKNIKYTASDFIVKKGTTSPIIESILIDGKKAVITFPSKMMAGTYSVTVKNETKETQVLDETLTTLSVIGTSLAETSKSPTAAAEIAYQALNQYGERMSGADNISITCSFGKAVVKEKATAYADGVIYVYEIPSNMAIVSMTGTIALVDSKTGVHSTTKITYALAATLSTMKFMGTYNLTTAMEDDIAVGDTISDFVFVFEGKNQYNAVMDAKAILKEGARIMITATPILSNITIAGNTVTTANLTTVVINGREYPALRLSSSNGVAKAVAGSMRLTVVNTMKGLVANETLNIQSGSAVKEVVIGARSTIYAEDKNELQYTVTGTDGKLITRYDSLKDMVEFTCSHDGDRLQWSKNPNGTAALIYIPAPTGYSGSDDRASVNRGITIVGNPKTPAMIITATSVKVNTTRKPVAIVGLSGATLACAKGEKIGFSLNNLLVDDQYGNRMTAELKYFPTDKQVYCIVSNVIGAAFASKSCNVLSVNLTANESGKFELDAAAVGSAMLYLSLNPKMDTNTAQYAAKIVAADTAQATDVYIKSINSGYDIEVGTNAKTSGLTKDRIAVYGKIGGMEIKIPTTQFVITSDSYMPITLSDGSITRRAIVEITVDTMRGTVPVSTVLTASYNYSNKERKLSDITANEPDASIIFSDTDSDTAITAADLIRGFSVLDQYGNGTGFAVSGIKYNVVVVSGNTGLIIHNNTNEIVIPGTKGDTVTLMVTAMYNESVKKQSIQFTFKGRTTDSQRVAQAKAAITDELRTASYATVDRAKQAILDLKQSGIRDVKMGLLNGTNCIATITFIDGSTKDYVFTNILSN